MLCVSKIQRFVCWALVGGHAAKLCSKVKIDIHFLNFKLSLHMTQLHIEHQNYFDRQKSPEHGCLHAFTPQTMLLSLFANTVRGRLGLLWNILKVKHVQRPSSPETLTGLQSKSQVLDGRRRSPKAPWPAERRNGWVKTRRLKMKHKAVPPGSRLVHQRNKFLTPV